MKPYGEQTVIKAYDEKIIAELTNFEIPILFIFTNVDYDIKAEEDEESDQTGKYERDKKQNVILDEIKKKFNKNSTINVNEYIDKYIKFYFVNLIKKLKPKVPAYGIDEVLSFFQNSVKEEDWKQLLECCKKKDINLCSEYCQNNPFLKPYKDLNVIKERNKKEALNYLLELKYGSFFSGLIPFVNIPIHSRYKHLFKNRLIVLYGFECNTEEDKTIEKEDIKQNETKESKEIDESENLINTRDEGEELISEKIHEKEKKSMNLENIKSINKTIKQDDTSKERSLGVISKGIIDIGLPVVEFVATATIGTFSFIFIPIVMIGSGIWSVYNIDNDCKKILDIFDIAFLKNKFITLEHYIKAFRDVIRDIESLGRKLVQS